MFKVYFMIIYILRTEVPRCTAVPTGQWMYGGNQYPAMNCWAITNSPYGTVRNQLYIRLTELTVLAFMLSYENNKKTKEKQNNKILQQVSDQREVIPRDKRIGRLGRDL